MNTLKTLETFIRFSLQSLEAQVNLIDALGPHRDRSSFIEKIKRMTLYLQKITQETQDGIIEIIEAISEDAIGQTAAINKLFAQITSEVADDESRQELLAIQNFAAKSHDTTVKRVGKKEADTEKYILETFQRIDGATKELLAKIDRLRQ